MAKEILVLKGDHMDAWGLACADLVPDAKGGALEAQGAAELQNLLNLGYEPFAITQFMRVPQSVGIMSVAAKQPVLCDKVWLRLKTRVKLDESPIGPSKTS